LEREQKGEKFKFSQQLIFEQSLNKGVLSEDGKSMVLMFTEKYIAKLLKIQPNGIFSEDYQYSNHTAKLNLCAITKKGDFCITGSFDKSIRVWSSEEDPAERIASNNLIMKLPFGSNLKKMAVSPDSRYLMTQSTENEFRLAVLNETDGNYHLSNELFKEREKDKNMFQTDCVDRIVFSSDSKHVAATYFDEIIIWKIDAHHKLNRLDRIALDSESYKIFTSISFMNQNCDIVCGSDSQKIYYYSIGKNGRYGLSDTIYSTDGAVNSVSPSANDDLLFIGSSQGGIKVYLFDNDYKFDQNKGNRYL